jgi:hypothetical protein
MLTMRRGIQGNHDVIRTPGKDREALSSQFRHLEATTWINLAYKPAGLLRRREAEAEHTETIDQPRVHPSGKRRCRKYERNDE